MECEALFAKPKKTVASARGKPYTYLVSSMSPLIWIQPALSGGLFLFWHAIGAN
jgi:hypothetical protein